MIVNIKSDLADCWTVQAVVKYLPVADKNEPRDRDIQEINSLQKELYELSLQSS